MLDQVQRPLFLGGELGLHRPVGIDEEAATLAGDLLDPLARSPPTSWSPCPTPWLPWCGRHLQGCAATCCGHGPGDAAATCSVASWAAVSGGGGGSLRRASMLRANAICSSRISCNAFSSTSTGSYAHRRSDVSPRRYSRCRRGSSPAWNASSRSRQFDVAFATRPGLPRGHVDLMLQPGLIARPSTNARGRCRRGPRS